MDNIIDKAGELAGNIKEYADNRIAAVKLKVAEKTSKIIAIVIAGSVVAVFLLLCLMFLGHAAADVLSAWIGKAYIAYLIVAAIYFLLAILLWRAKERIIRIPVMNSILQQLLGDETDKDHE